MAENIPITFSYQEIVTDLLKREGIHEGIWALFVEFGITGANMQFAEPGTPPPDPSVMPPENLLPTAIIPIKKIGIIKTNFLSNLSVDAAVVNPKPSNKIAKKGLKK